MLSLDTSRAPGRPAEVLALVRAIEAAEPSDESSWLEWKSTLDFGSGKGARVHVARAILGFANRMPEDAARHMEGHGYLVVGAEPGSIQGIPALDPVELDDQVTPFIGSAGPRWQPHFLSVDGKTVLVVVVDPPRWGDPICTVRKSSEGITDGAVLVRGKGGTRPATSAEMDNLQRRLRVPATADQLSISIEVAEPEAVTPIDLSAGVEDWLDEQELELLRALPNPPGLGALSALSGMTRIGVDFGVLSKELPEDRTEEKYRQQIADYIDLCRQRLPRVMKLAASRELAPLVLRAQNLTAKNVPDLVVEVHIAGAVEAILPDERASVADDQLPRPPRKWGPRPNPALAPAWNLPAVRADFPVVPFVGPDIRNGGSTDIRFPSVDLRPHRSAELDPVVLLVSEPPGSVLHASWNATSSGVDGTVSGEFTIPVGSTPWTVRDWAELKDD